MSDLIVQIVEIKEVLDHDNAERLQLALIDGWVVVVGKGQFKAGDKAIYFPIDSVLSEATEKIIFADSKIQLEKHRIRTIRIRGKISQGLLADLSKFPELAKLKVGTDVAERLAVSKYEPPVPEYQQQVPGTKKVRRKENPLFVKYTALSHFKWNTNVLQPGVEVVITETIHGLQLARRDSAHTSGLSLEEDQEVFWTTACHGILFWVA